MPYRPDLFARTLAALRYGATQDDLSEALSACVQRAQETGKQATLTLTIKLKPNGSTGQYVIADKIETKLPALDQDDTLMFGTPEGNLQRTDPRQAELTDFEKAAEDRPGDFAQAQ